MAKKKARKKAKVVKKAKKVATRSRQPVGFKDNGKMARELAAANKCIKGMGKTINRLHECIQGMNQA